MRGLGPPDPVASPGAGPSFVLVNLASAATPVGPAPLLRDRLDRIDEIPQAALAVRDGRIAWLGPESSLPLEFRDLPRQDGRRGTLLPGFVDPHTHMVFAGDRADEFDRRARGAKYLEILAAGGGILDTVRKTRAATEASLFASSLARAQRLAAHGTTTAEIKSGYGLDLPTELKILRVVRWLGLESPLRVVPTFMGAHATPPEFQGRTGAYVDHLVEEMLPEVARAGLARFVDVFCEKGVFEPADTRRILAAAKALGVATRIHADEVHDIGGGRLAAECGAVSADHLIAVSEDSMDAMAAAGTAATVLPGTALVLGKGRFAPARKMIEKGIPLALATDLNPGSCHLESLPFAMQVAVVQMGLTPAEALAAGTLNAAHTLGLAAELGSLEPGKHADLVLIDAPGYRHLAYRLGTNLVVGTWVGGRRVGAEAAA